jgi:hypothetical protein
MPVSKADVVVSASDPDPARLPGGQWPRAIYDILKAFDVHHMSYVPDAGHSTLIKLLSAAPEVTSNVLTTEEEGNRRR